jgi:hypothetical protein
MTWTGRSSLSPLALRFLPEFFSAWRRYGKFGKDPTRLPDLSTVRRWVQRHCLYGVIVLSGR